MMLYDSLYPSLSASKGVNQQVMWFTPFITPQKLHCLRKLIAFLLLQYSFVFVKVTTITHYKYDLRIY